MKICEYVSFSPNAYNDRGKNFCYSCRHYAMEFFYIKEVYKSFQNYFWKIWSKVYSNLLRVKLFFITIGQIGQNYIIIIGQSG